MRIGVLAAQAGLSTKTIRFYEDAGLLPEPPRTPAGYRDYPAGAAARLAFVRDAQSAGLGPGQHGQGRPLPAPPRGLGFVDVAGR